MRVLDLSFCVIIPMVNNREEAEKAVAACRYPPEAIDPLVDSRCHGGGKGYAKEANEQIACLAMIETPEGRKC